MIENRPQGVSVAFEILLEEVEAEIDFINGVGAKAFAARDYDRAREVLEHAGIMTVFRDKVAALRREWDVLAAAAERDEDEETRAERRNPGRLRKGVRTPESRYYEPILRILVDMGGSGKVADVLEKVERVMRPTLNQIDYEPLASDPDNPRWRNAAQWARHSMVKEGLLKPNSPRGVWEISESGRQWLVQQRQAV